MILAKHQYFFYAGKNGSDREEIISGGFFNARADLINQPVKLPHQIIAELIRFVGNVA